MRIICGCLELWDLDDHITYFYDLSINIIYGVGTGQINS